MLQTRLTRQYGIQVPFVSAGMGFVAMPELVAAVSNAGGLGLLGVSPLPPQAMNSLVGAVRTLTDRPFGVDLVIADTAFGPSTTEEHVRICAEERVDVAVFFWNLPPADWIEMLHSSGVRVWAQIGSIERAREAIERGADAVIVQGSEAGGHNHSSTALFSLVPATVDAVAPVPVIAAGGIADGRGLAAAMALGADGVCVGTRLLASVEANAHREYKQRVVAATAKDVVRTCIFGPEWPDQPMRVLRNRVVDEWSGRNDKVTPTAVGASFIGRTSLGGQEYPMPKFSAVLPTPETSGDFEEMCLPAGESAGLTREIKPAGDIVREMTNEASELLERLGRSGTAAVV
jgi:nitronate monooxygenase